MQDCTSRLATRARCAQYSGSGGTTPMLSSMMLRTLGRVVTMTLVAQVGVASTGEGSCGETEAKQFQAANTRTAKERLGGKASDEQRVDNCKVPFDLRGPKPRPDECRDGVSARPKR
jgi:hypothetical protein